MFARNYKEYLINKANKLGLVVNLSDLEFFGAEWYSEMEKIIKLSEEGKEKLEELKLNDEIRKDMLTITKGLLLSKNIEVLEIIENFFMDSNDIIVSNVYVDLDGDEFMKVHDELCSLLENYSKTKTGKLCPFVFLKSKEEYDLLMEDYEREKNESETESAEFDVADLKNSLNSLIVDRSLDYHHWYRSYTIFDVKATENKDVYRIAYLDHERFDIIDVRMKEQTRDQYIHALHIMKREGIRKKGCVDGKHLTFIERIVKSVREKVTDIVEYGDTWQVDSWFGDDYNGYISIIPATRSSCYNPCVCLKLKGNIERVIDLSNKELSDLIERISEEGLAYAKEMAPNIRRGNPYENKYEDEESLYGYTKIEKHFDF